MPLLFSLGLLVLMVWGTACNDSDNPDVPGIVSPNGIEVATMPAEMPPGTTTDTAATEAPPTERSSPETAPPSTTSPETASPETPSPETTATSSAPSATATTATTEATAATATATARRPCVLSGDDWSGIFYNTATPGSETITARVSYGAEGITIKTSKRSPPGQSFSGTVNGNCSITMIDLFDGEDWTTKFGQADDTQLRLADFVIDEDNPIDGTNTPPLNVIELFR